MNRSQAFTKRKVIISPNNQPSGNVYSSTTFPQIQFVLGSSPGLADFKTLRLNYTFQAKSTAGNPVRNTPSANTNAAHNGMAVSNRIGSTNAFQQINISTMNGRNLETILNLNRYLATISPNQINQFDYLNTFQGQDPLLSTKSIGCCRQMNVPVEVSTPLRTGFLSNSTPINLSQKGIHGCVINILLDQNANVIGPVEVVTQDTDGSQSVLEQTASGTISEGFQYQLSNVFLSYDVYVPNDQVYSSMPSSGQITFNSINSMTSTLLASDQTITLRTGLKNLISATHSTIPATHLNNIKKNGMKLERLSINATASSNGTPVSLNTAQFFKGGVLFPANTILDSEEQGLKNPQSQIIQPALNSITLNDNDHQLLNPQTSVGLNNSSGFNVQQKSLSINQVPDPDSDFVLGVATDTSQQGVDYSRQDYAIRLQSDLNGATPFQFFSFFRARNVIQYTPMGVEVME